MRRSIAVLAVALSASATAFAGDIRILTEPEGAEIKQESVRLGVTTKEGLRVVGLEPGKVTFTITKAGFETETRTVSVESASEPVTVLVRLRPATPGATGATQTAPKPDASPAAGSKKAGGSKVALILLGTAAVVGGGVALAAGHGSTASPQPTTTTLPPVARLADLSATVTSPQEGRVLNCNDPAFISVKLTNAAPALVHVSGVRRHQASVVGDCTSVPDFTYRVTNSQVGTGSANVLSHQSLFNGGVGCCVHPGCRVSCQVGFSFTVLTSVGDVPAGRIDYGIAFNGCSVCSSAASMSTGCLAKP